MARFLCLMAISTALHALLLLGDFSLSTGGPRAESSPSQIGYVSRSLDDFRPQPRPAVTAEVVEPKPQPQAKPQPSTPQPVAGSSTTGAVAEVKEAPEDEVRSRREPQPRATKKTSPGQNSAAATVTARASAAKGGTTPAPAGQKPESQSKFRSEKMKPQRQVSVASLSLPEVAEPLAKGVATDPGKAVSKAAPAQAQQRTKNVPQEIASAGEAAAAAMTSPSVSEYQSALPRYKINPKPDYPRVARLRGWEGQVLFQVEVLKTGEVGAVTLVASSGYRSLDRAADRAVRRWRFKPATRLGVPVGSAVRVPIEFALER